MKILEKTLKKIILEVEINELKFDQIWDDVRSSYPATNFEIETIRNNFDSTMIITFKIKNQTLSNKIHLSFSASTNNFIQ
jgi:hypothetical protein